jgi:hypothetical protein
VAALPAERKALHAMASKHGGCGIREPQNSICAHMVHVKLLDEIL